MNRGKSIATESGAGPREFMKWTGDGRKAFECYDRRSANGKQGGRQLDLPSI